MHDQSGQRVSSVTAFSRVLGRALPFLVAAIGSDLSGEAYRRTLYQPYGVHGQHNSSTVNYTITNQVLRSVETFKATLLLPSSVVVASGPLSDLLLINWKVCWRRRPYLVALTC